MATISRSSISFAAAAAWIAPAAAIVGLAGAYPAWLHAGARGLLAEAVCGATVLAVMLASAAVTVRYASRGAAAAAYAFALAGIARVAACVGLLAGAWKLFDLPLTAMLLWLAAFYVALLAVESFWLHRALARMAQNRQKTVNA